MADLRTWIELAILLLACFIASLFLIPHVSAEDELNGSYVVEWIEDAVDTLLGNEGTDIADVPYIYQGDSVYVGDVIDISGVVPPYDQLAYWDGFDMYDEAPEYNITLEYRKGPTGFYQFYLDSDIFERRLGWWYKYSGEFEPQGNNKAFKVLPRAMKNSTLRFPNGTLINQSTELPHNYTQHEIPPAPLLPERQITDYVVARGDSLNMTENDTRFWIFGRLDGIYDHSPNFTAEELERIEPGNYKVVSVSAGPNTIFEARYDNDTIIPGLFGKAAVDVRGMSAPVVYTKFLAMLAGTDDRMDEYRMEVAFPYITINRVDEILINDKTVLDVRGYTNTADGTLITVVLNEKTTYYKDIGKYTARTNAVRTSPGNLSYYRALVPIDYNELAADARNHTLEARTALGGTVQKDFKISVMPPDSYRPNVSLKYIEDRNPFIPTPTPEVVTIVVTQVVEVPKPYPVTPSNEQVYAQQKKAEDTKWSEFFAMVTGAAMLVFIAALAAFVIWYLYSVYKRGKEPQQ